MKANLLYRCVVTSFCFVAGGAAVMYGFYLMLKLMFWSVPVFAALFCGIWASHAFVAYHWEDPEWMDRPRILVRIKDGEESR